MKEIGKKTNNMDKVLRLGLMVPNMMVNMLNVKSMDKVESHGLIARINLVNSKKIIFKVMELTIGLMADNL